MKSLVGFAFLLLLVPDAAAWAGAPDGNLLVQPTLVVATAAVEAGKPFQAAVVFKVEPTWHIYWINPGDSGQPPEVKWNLPAGFTAGELRWPTPHRFILPGGIVNYGYEDEAILLTTITPPAAITDTSIALAADVSWLVCTADICLPGEGKVTANLPAGKAAPAHTELFARAESAIPEVTQVPPSNQVTINDEGAEVAARQDWPAGVSHVEWFIIPPERVVVEQQSVSTAGRSSDFSAKLKPMAGNKFPAGDIYSVVAYTDETGRRKGMVYWLRVKDPSTGGGTGQSAK